MAEPAITVPAYHVSAGQNEPINRVVIHATSPGMAGTTSSAAGMALATAHYFQSPASGGSAHYIEDIASEEHCVADAAIAQHAPPNPHSIGIEICGETTYTYATWLSPAVWPAVRLAQIRAQEVCHRFGVPWVRLRIADLLAGHRGVCGHVDVSNAWHQTDHTDPGPNFPWREFMAVPNPTPPLPPPLTDPEEPTVLVPVQLPPTANGEGWWDCDGVPADPVSGQVTKGYPRPLIDWAKFRGLVVNGDDTTPAATDRGFVRGNDHGGILRITFAGFPPGSAPLIWATTCP